MTERNEMARAIETLRDRREKYSSALNPNAESRQRARGKMLALERVEALCDPGSFWEIGGLVHEPGPTAHQVETPRAPRDGVVTGIGLIHGNPVCIASDDATVFGGARGAYADEKIEALRKISLERGYPFVSLLEGSAGRIQDAIGATAAAVGGPFRTHYELRGKVPTIAAIMGYCFGGPAFFAALSDFIIQVRGTGYIAMSGPPVIRAGTGQEATPAQIGSPEVQAAVTGLVDYVAENETECLSAIRDFLGLVSNTPVSTSDIDKRDTSELELIVPGRFKTAYDMRKVLNSILDNGEFFELKSEYGKNVITALAQMGGQTIGIVASQPMYRAGMIEKPAAIKMTRFIDLCSRLNIPLVFLQDVPGFHVGIEVEESGQVRDAADLLTAVISSKVPKVTVILRKSYGLAYLAMGGKALGADFVFAWPLAEIGLMGPGAAARVMAGADGSSEEIESLTADYAAQMSPFIAAGTASIDDIIEPRETRNTILQALFTAGAR